MNSTNLIYYRLTSKSDDSIDVTADWYGKNYPPRTWCSACGEAYPKSGDLEPIPIDTRGGQLRFRLPLEHLSGINYDVIRDDLLEAIGTEARAHLSLGVLFDENGREISNYHTAQARAAVLVRGGPASGDNGICRGPTEGGYNECGSHGYFPMPPGYGYLLRSTFREEVPILRIQVGNFAVNRAIRDRIVAAGLGDGMYIHRLPVLGEPEDGLPVDLKFYEKV